MLLLKRIAMFTLLACACSAQDELGLRWEEFHSSAGFSVMYPASWFRIGLSSENRLDILSSKGGAEAIVIKRGQAEVSVIEGPSSAALSQMMGEDAREALSIMSRTDIRNENAERSGCNELKEVISRHEAVPAEDVPIRVPHIVDTDFYCEVNGRKFTTRLRNWEGDARQREYQRIALHIARSLHLTQ